MLCGFSQDSEECSKQRDKFFFNPANDRCENFHPQKCGDKFNVFETLERCQMACEGDPTVSPPTTKVTTLSEEYKRKCLTPLNKTKCSRKTRWKVKWYFNSTSKRCRIYRSYDCNYNDNSHESQVDCELTCGLREYHDLVYPDLCIWPWSRSSNQNYYITLAGPHAVMANALRECPKCKCCNTLRTVLMYKQSCKWSKVRHRQRIAYICITIIVWMRVY